MADIVVKEEEKKEWGSPSMSISTLTLADDPEYVTFSGLLGRIHFNMANIQTGTSSKPYQKDGIWQF